MLTNYSMKTNENKHQTLFDCLSDGKSFPAALAKENKNLQIKPDTVE